jgi:uncharacterized protein (TIGR02001 family)
MTKRVLSGVAGACALAVSSAAFAPANAQELEVTGNVAITSDYAFRGLSQTLEQPAVQGGLDVAAPFGLYAGVWGSSINFGEDLDGADRAQMELDIYGGIAPSAGGFDFDLGLLYYAYPGALSGLDYNFLEAYAGVAREVGPVSLGLNGAYSPDFFAASGTGVFGSVDASVALPFAPVSVDGSVGMQAIEDNDAFGTPDYTVWSVGLSTEVYGTGIGGAVTGTDLSVSECFGGSDLCKTRVILNVSRAL